MRFSGAQWIGPTPNMTAGGMGTVRGLVLHIDQGSEAGSIAWCMNPASQVSAHFFNPKSGGLAQMVDTADMAWAEVDGNPNWISVEHEGNSGDSLTSSQIANDAALLAWLHAQYGVPLVATDDPNGSGVGWHGMGGVDWGDHPDCPGAPIVAQRSAIIAAAGGSSAPSPGAPAYPGYTVQQGSTGPVVIEVQRQLIALGYSCGPTGDDGIFGPNTAGAVGRFQLDHHVANSVRSNGTPDEIVGPATWAALF